MHKVSNHFKNNIKKFLKNLERMYLFYSFDA